MSVLQNLPWEEYSGHRLWFLGQGWNPGFSTEEGKNPGAVV
jgi:hypothetical protein